VGNRGVLLVTNGKIGVLFYSHWYGDKGNITFLIKSALELGKKANAPDYWLQDPKYFSYYLLTSSYREIYSHLLRKYARKGYPLPPILVPVTSPYGTFDIDPENYLYVLDLKEGNLYLLKPGKDISIKIDEITTEQIILTILTTYKENYTDKVRI